MRRQILAPVLNADAQLLTSLIAFGPQRQSVTLEVMHQHEKLAPESGLEFMVLISGACVRGLKVDINVCPSQTLSRGSALIMTMIMIQYLLVNK